MATMSTLYKCNTLNSSYSYCCSFYPKMKRINVTQMKGRRKCKKNLENL